MRITGGEGEVGIVDIIHMPGKETLLPGSDSSLEVLGFRKLLQASGLAHMENITSGRLGARVDIAVLNAYHRWHRWMSLGPDV